MRRFACGVLALLLGSSAQAQDLASFLDAMRRARHLEVHGTVESSVYFPPRGNPTRRVRTLPRVEFVPWLVQRNFDLSAGTNETLAGRGVVRYDLTPKRGSADRWTIWLDARWDVPLAYEQRTSTGEVIRRAAFTRVQGKPRRRLNIMTERVSDPPFRQAVLRGLPGLALPETFEPVGCHASETGREILLSDGLNVLALVIAPRDVQGGSGVTSRRVGPYYLWLIGSLPQAQLRDVIAQVQDVKLEALEFFAPQEGGR
ncbi:hypothetical protein [Deinococcus peraridilitoris]|uniref:Sigma E regulatory protein, MucB/RseB n=1 Tax=Deinococcus peraridilitoris (strain DSM 19664 / LMG 22246 / CIP 109416 / KR-200) TaxID=937777 RepID=L0A4T7_DEIPD|nr:hypothetical protein [Deinococcus peraridilitoris]AFZ68182.1 hypothetical protein Deipe_2717 [Deinococcus peraridilitoris DSM 19664]